MCEENWNDIREQIEYEAETEGDRECEASSIISPWESFKTTESPSNLQTIIEIAKAKSKEENFLLSNLQVSGYIFSRYDTFIP